MSSTTTEPRVRALPTEADSKAITNALQHAHDLLESVEWAVNAVGRYDHRDYPEQVTHEKMGVLTDIRAVLNGRIEDFQRMSQSIDSAMFSLGAFRLEQKAGRGQMKGGDDA